MVNSATVKSSVKRHAGAGSRCFFAALLWLPSSHLRMTTREHDELR